MKVGDKKRNYCTDCYKVTNHKILSLESVDGSDDYHQSDYYMVVICEGCNNVSYRTEYVDYEQIHEDGEGGWEPTVTVLTYPQVLSHHRRLEDTYYLPKDIEIIYNEAINAFSSKCYLLTAIAFRTIIEAICINKAIKTQNIDGDDLSAKIDKMVKKGLITQNESERLHAIRFKGNDSVHDMVVPKPKQLHVVLDVIEHLLKNLYIIDKGLDRNLDTVIKNFPELKILLSKHLSKLTLGQSLPLGKILGKSARRLSTKSKALEKELQEKIKNGDYKNLTLGEVKPHTDPKRGNVQYYIIADLTFELDDFEF